MHSTYRLSGLAFRELVADTGGAYLIVVGLILPALIGMAGIGTEVGLWLYKRQTLQAAADSAAISAATSYYYTGGAADINTEADAVAASYGFVNNQNGVVVSVSRPPASGSYTSTPSAIEVLVQQPQTPLLLTLTAKSTFNVLGRAVAIANGGKACTLSLNKSASGATSVKGTASVTLNNCSMYSNSNSASAVSVSGSSTVSALSVDAVGGISGTNNITASQGIASNQPAIVDPYATLPLPAFSGCDSHNYTAKTTTTINPGVYCGGIQVNAGANLSLTPGIYFLDRGSLMVNGGASISGTGVTLIFTSSTGNNFASASINGGASVNLTPPTDPSSPTRGIVFFGDRNMPTGTTFKFNGGASQVLTGAIYLPKAAIDYAGGANTVNGCTQIVGDTVTFTGNSNLSIDCSLYKTKPLGSAIAQLVE